MPKLKETLYPFGESCEPFTPETELTEDQKAWLIESGRATEEDFQGYEAVTETTEEVVEETDETTEEVVEENTNNKKKNK